MPKVLIAPMTLAGLEGGFAVSSRLRLRAHLPDTRIPNDRRRAAAGAGGHRRQRCRFGALYAAAFWTRIRASR